MQRVAVIFDNTLRPETTGLYCRRALGELVRAGRLTEVEHVLPNEVDRIAPDRFDLFLFVDDGLQQKIPGHLQPSAWWAIDTHVDFERCLTLARQATLTFAAQRAGTEQLRRQGVSSTQWLPLACDPQLHGHHPCDHKYDVAFVGNVFPGERERLLNILADRYPRSFLGVCDYREMAATYSSAKAVFNRSINGDVNMRVFEGLCSGSLLVTNDLPDSGQNELFEPGRHLLTYASDDELLDTLDRYLNQDEERERITVAGRAEVLRSHTYRHRMETILEAMASQTTTLVKGDSAGPIKTTPDKAAPYYEFDRPDVLELVPESARRVLDIGCGGGRLGQSIKSHQPATVTGVEFQPEAAARAAQVLDKVIVGSVESADVDFPSGHFDCVICADVLEHLRHPEIVLRKIHRWLEPGGVLVTSIPNVRNHTVIQSLLGGNWTYESAGLLDEDHVRFFTRREIEKLLFRAGFAIDQMQMVAGEGYDEWQSAGSSLEVNVGGLQIRTGSHGEAEEFFAYQYLTRSQVVSPPPYGLTSIIIVTHNQQPYTQACLDSLRLRTDESYELIVVDNGSTDGSVSFLRSMADITLIENTKNRGFPAAVNQGLQRARGDNLLLLNNDCVVTTGWLRRLLEGLHSSNEIGLIGPVSNNVSGPQQVEAHYQHLNDLDGFAWDRHSRLGQAAAGEDVLSEVDRLVGFCLLMKRAAIDEVGLLDERFGVGCFEDDDLCRRVIQAGYRAVIARNAFVHHFGSVSFRASGVDFEQLMRENERRYLEKWADEGPDLNEKPSGNVASVVEETSSQPSFGIAKSESGGLALVPKPVTLSLCMIVRDNEETIRPCLESIRPWVDEMVIVDTGSTDTTPQICEELGARVFHWPWQDDFAAARNESLKPSRGEWIFWMDSDDTIPEACGRRLRELADGDHDDDVLGYTVQVHCPGKDPTDVTAVDHVKLFRNRSDLRFTFRIHEQILPAIRSVGGTVAWTDLHVVHSGSDHSLEGRQRKLERDFRLLGLELQDRPEHPFVLFNLGMTHADAGQHGEAISSLERCLQASEADESHVRKAYALLVGAYTHMERMDEAWAACQRGLARFPNDPELLFRRAMLEHQRGNLNAAAKTYSQILNEPETRQFASVDLGLAGFKARHNLAVVLEELGKFEDAEATWQLIIRDKSDYHPAWIGLGMNWMQQGRSAELDEMILDLLRHKTSKATGLQLSAAVAESNEQFGTARLCLEEALITAPHSLDLHEKLCRLLFERGELKEAVVALSQLIALSPDNAAAHHNLGLSRLQLGDAVGALSCFKESLRVRPDAPHTQELLLQAQAEAQDESDTDFTRHPQEPAQRQCPAKLAGGG